MPENLAHDTKKNVKLLIPGVHKGVNFTSETIRMIFNQTDWDNPMNRYLYWQHKDYTNPKTGETIPPDENNFLGIVENIHMQNDCMVGDVENYSEKLARMIKSGKFGHIGISPSLSLNVPQGQKTPIWGKINSFTLTPSPAQGAETKLSDQGSEIFELSISDPIIINLSAEEVKEQYGINIKKLNKSEMDEEAKEGSEGSESSEGELSEDERKELDELRQNDLARKKKEKEEEEMAKKKKEEYPEEKKTYSEEEELAKKKKEEDEEEMARKKKKEEDEYPEPKMSDEEFSDFLMEEAKDDAELSAWTDFVKKVGGVKEAKKRIKEYKSVKKDKKMSEELAEIRKENATIKEALSTVKVFRSHRRTGNETGSAIPTEGGVPQTIDLSKLSNEQVYWKMFEQMQEEISGGVMNQDIGEAFELNLSERSGSLIYQPNVQVLNLATTATDVTSARGSAITGAYGNIGIEWASRMLDATMGSLVFEKISTPYTVSKGNGQFTVPIKTIYDARLRTANGIWEAADGESPGSGEVDDLTMSEMTNVDNVQFDVSESTWSSGLTRQSVRQTRFDMMKDAMQELQYKIRYEIDSALSQALCGTITASAANGSGPTEMASDARGAQTLFAGDATTKDDTLTTAHTLDLDIIRKARTLLKSKTGFYWDNGVHGASTIRKNPWTGTEGDLIPGGYTLIIDEFGEESLLGDEQFSNNAIAGTDETIRTGRLYNYLGMNIMVTPFLPTFVDGQYTYVKDETDDNYTKMNVNGAVGLLVKEQACSGIAWDVKPLYEKWYEKMKKKYIFSGTIGYDAKALHKDAIVRIIYASGY